MNTHDKIVKCRSCDYVGPCDPTCCERPDYDGATAEEAWQAAIEADRKHFAETLSALSGDAAGMYEQECDSYFNGLSDGYDYAAQVLRGEEKSADRKRRGEPVVQFRTMHCADWYDGYPDHSDGGGPYETRTLYTAPQPAEPEPCFCDRMYPDSNPDASCGDCPTRDYKKPAEPVKSHLKVSYDDKGDCLYVCCDSNEPAEAEENEQGVLLRRAFSDGRLVGVTIPNFMGRYDEPVKVPSMRDLIADDAYAATFQSLGQYRKALLARYGGGTP